MRHRNLSYNEKVNKSNRELADYQLTVLGFTTGEAVVDVFKSRGKSLLKKK